MSRLDLLAQRIGELKNHLANTNAANQNIKRQQAALSSAPQISSQNNLLSNLRSILPRELVPGNVGELNQVAWDFSYILEFDFGTDPALTNNSRLTSSFQVSQEAAIVLTGIQRFANEYDTPGDLGPFQIEIRDRQSSRFFQNAPIPIQAIGQKGYITPLPTGFLLMPNAFVDVTMSTWLDAGVTQPTIGDGFHQFYLHGYRVRVEDANKVLSSIYG